MKDWIKGNMPPSKLKIKKIKRALKIPPSSSWELEMSCNFTPERDALIAIHASEMERYDLEFTEGVDSLNSDSDSEFPDPSDTDASDASSSDQDDSLRGNSTSSDTDSDAPLPYRRPGLGNYDAFPVCSGCDLSEYESVHQFYKNERSTTDFLIKHGVFPSMETMVNCPVCYALIEFDHDSYDPNENPYAGWTCKTKAVWVTDPKRGKKKKTLKRCGPSVNLRTGTFISRSQLPCWKPVLMGVAYCQKDHRHIRNKANLKVSIGTSAFYRKRFHDTTLQWIENQRPIGGRYPTGAPIIVELDESLFISKRNRRGSKRSTEAVWVFGGVERYSKKSFLIPLFKTVETKTGAKKWVKSLLRDSDTLIPLIKKYVKQGSVVITDGWTAYLSLPEHGYIHHRIVHQKYWIHPRKPFIHTQTIERLWGSIKDIGLRKGQRKQYLKEIISRYIFLHRFSYNEAIHEFFVLLGKKYRHPYL